jgi:ABC-type transporter Mla subunit MlaD
MMAKKQRNEVMAGLLTLCTIGLLLGVILWMGAAEWFRTTGQQVVFFAPTEAGMLGIEPGAGVQINDARVGKVVDVEYSPQAGGTWYVCELFRKDVAVTSQAVAEVVAPFIGQPAIVVSDTGAEADADAPLADARDRAVKLRVGGFMGALEMAGKQIATELDTGNKTSLLSTVKGIAEQLHVAAGNVNAVSQVAVEQFRAADSQSLLAKVRRSMDDLNLLTSRLATQTDVEVDHSLLAKVHVAVNEVNRTIGRISRQTDPAVAASLVSKVHRAMDDVNRMTTAIRPDVTAMAAAGKRSMEKVDRYVQTDVAEILEVLKDTNQRINRVARDFGELSSGAREILAVNRVSIDEMIDDFSLSASEFKAAVQELRRAPWKLFHRPDEGEVRATDIYNAAASFAAGAEQLDQALTKLQKLSAAYPEGVPEDNVQLRRIRKHIQEVFRRFRVAEKALFKELEQAR